MTEIEKLQCAVQLLIKQRDAVTNQVVDLMVALEEANRATAQANKEAAELRGRVLVAETPRDKMPLD